MQQRMIWAAAAVVVALAGGAWWWTQQGGASDAERAAQSASGASSGSWAGIGGSGEGAAAPVPTATLTAEQVRQRLFTEGTLQGTEPSGDWCVRDGKSLAPCKGLRDRFEYYILGIGQVSIGDIRTLIEDEARRELGEQIARAIMDIFDKYWQLRTYGWKNQFVQSDRSTWMPVFEEQRSVRRQILGQAWADAFFQSDEKYFQDYYAQLESGQPPPPHPGEPVPEMAPGKDPAAVRAERVARYGEDAAQRLEAVDAQWAEWDRRLAAARTEWERIQGLPNLSESQKQDEMARYVETHFQDKDRIRVRALLKLR